MSEYSCTFVKINPYMKIWYYFVVDKEGGKERISDEEYQRRSGKPLRRNWKFSPKCEWTSKEKISEILSNYSNLNQTHRLIVCHGHEHEKFAYLPSYDQAILLDANPYVEPDILGNMLDLDFIERFPKGYFQEIYTAHCPLGTILDLKDKRIWKTFDYLLSFDGKAFLDTIIWHYSYKLKGGKIKEIKKQIEEFLSDYFTSFEYLDIKQDSFRIKEKGENQIIKLELWHGMTIASK